MATQTCNDGKVRGKREATPARNCLTTDCTGQFGGEYKGGRGLCKICHRAASILVKKKATTWEELEQLGLCDPPFKSKFEKAFKLAKKKLENNN